MNPNPTTPKTIRSILDELAEGEKNWIHDQLDGTSMVGEALQGVDIAINKALAEITQIEEECAPYIRGHLGRNYYDGQAKGWNESTKEFKRNLEA